MPAVPATVTTPFECVDTTSSYVDGKFSASITFQCAWSLRHTLAEELIGRKAFGVGTALTYVLPAAHPDKPFAFVKDIVSIRGYPETNPDFDVSGAATQSYPDYKFARLVATYEIPPWGAEPPGGGNEAFTEENIEGGTEFLSLGNDQLLWDSDKTPVPPIAAPAIQLRTLVFAWRLSGIQTLPQETLTLIGTVNDVQLKFYTLGMTVGAETLLYTPPTLKRYIYANGAGAWDASFRFPYRPTGWNKFYRPGNTTPEYMCKGPIGSTVLYKPYPLGDFTKLRLRT